MTHSIADHPTITCPDWCTVTDHSREVTEALSDPRTWITHDGPAQAFGELTSLERRSSASEGVVIYQTQSQLLDGTMVQAGMMLNEHFLDVEDMEEFVQAIRGARRVERHGA